MSDRDFGMLRDAVHAPVREVSAEGLAIAPVQTGLFDADGNPMLTSFIGVLPSLRGALAAIRAFFGDRWQPGDVALTNDMDAGAFNACEIITAAPIHAGATIIGWSVIRGRVPDFGGWEPGGYSPQAVDRWAEGGRLEPVKVMLRGTDRREVIDLLRLNSRTPASTLANVRLLAQAAIKLGQSYASRAMVLREQIAELRADELQRVETALGNLAQTAFSREAEIVAPWLNRSFGNLTVAVGTSANRLAVSVSGPAIAGCPLNLGHFAAEDIVVGAIAAVCGLDDVLTDAAVSRIDIAVQGPGLVRASLPAPVALGRQVTGEVLFKTMVQGIGRSEAEADASWQRYREKAGGGGLDPRTGKLAIPESTRVRELQNQQVAA